VPLHRRHLIARVASLPLVAVPVPPAATRTVLDRGGLVRGSHDPRRLTLVFTGDHQAAGGLPILDAAPRPTATWSTTRMN
jgi:hypothetical protein